jgi:hypothetical protein
LGHLRDPLASQVTCPKPYVSQQPSLPATNPRDQASQSVSAINVSCVAARTVVQQGCREATHSKQHPPGPSVHPLERPTLHRHSSPQAGVTGGRFRLLSGIDGGCESRGRTLMSGRGRFEPPIESASGRRDAAPARCTKPPSGRAPPSAAAGPIMPDHHTDPKNVRLLLDGCAAPSRVRRLHHPQRPGRRGWRR